MFTTGLIIVALIILTFFAASWYTGKPMAGLLSSDAPLEAPLKLPTTAAEAFGGHPPGCNCRRCMSPEGMALNNNMEYFSASQVAGSGNVADYGASDFIGGNGGAFKDYIMGQAVDPQSYANHREFVKDRMAGNPQNITGRTFAMGEIESDSGVPWQGLRRGQALPDAAMGNPTQVTDFRAADYSTKPRFTWSSGSM